MQVDVKVDFNVPKISDHIDKGIASANKELIPILTNYARSNHRYNDRTGNLTQSTVTRDISKGLQLYAAANYGQYVHQGHGTWISDPWLENTIKENEQLISNTYSKHIADELRRM